MITERIAHSYNEVKRAGEIIRNKAVLFMGANRWRAANLVFAAGFSLQAACGIGGFTPDANGSNTPNIEAQSDKESLTLEQKQFLWFQNFLKDNLDPNTNAQLFRDLEKKTTDPNLSNHFTISEYQMSDDALQKLQEPNSSDTQTFYRSMSYTYRFDPEIEDSLDYDILVGFDEDVNGKLVAEGMFFYLRENGELRNSTNTPETRVNYESEQMKQSTERALKEKGIVWEELKNSLGEPLERLHRSTKQETYGTRYIFIDNDGQAQFIKVYNNP